MSRETREQDYKIKQQLQQDILLGDKQEYNVNYSNCRGFNYQRDLYREGKFPKTQFYLYITELHDLILGGKPSPLLLSMQRESDQRIDDDDIIDRDLLILKLTHQLLFQSGVFVPGTFQLCRDGLLNVKNEYGQYEPLESYRKRIHTPILSTHPVRTKNDECDKNPGN